VQEEEWKAITYNNRLCTDDQEIDLERWDVIMRAQMVMYCHRQLAVSIPAVLKDDKHLVSGGRRRRGEGRGGEGEGGREREGSSADTEGPSFEGGARLYPGRCVRYGRDREFQKSGLSLSPPLPPLPPSLPTPPPFSLWRRERTGM